MSPETLPIGYWLKQADLLLTKGIDAIQSSFGLTRTDWQILNSLAEHDASMDKPELLSLMRPFLDAASAEQTIAQLKDKALITESDQHLSLTEKGRAQHAACLARQKTFREGSMASISDEAYLTTVQTLQRIVENIKGTINS